MEVNNYQSFASYMEQMIDGGYTEYPCLLLFTQKKRDIKIEEYTAFKKIVTVANYKKIDIEKVKKTCLKNKCRCYVMVIDKFFLKVASKLALTTEAMIDFITNEIYESSGLHLIDIDEVLVDINGIVEFIDKLGGKYQKLFKSKSGYSLAFYGKAKIVKEYNEALGSNDTNKAHNVCAINLYIPNYHECK